MVLPGHALFSTGVFDRLSLYPVTQGSSIISKRPHEGGVAGVDFIRAPSADRIPVDFEAAVCSKLNTNEIRKFHEQVGLEYRAWREEGIPATCSCARWSRGR